MRQDSATLRRYEVTMRKIVLDFVWQMNVDDDNNKIPNVIYIFAYMVSMRVLMQFITFVSIFWLCTVFLKCKRLAQNMNTFFNRENGSIKRVFDTIDSLSCFAAAQPLSFNTAQPYVCVFIFNVACCACSATISCKWSACNDVLLQCTYG